AAAAARELVAASVASMAGAQPGGNGGATMAGNQESAAPEALAESAVATENTAEAAAPAGPPAAAEAQPDRLILPGTSGPRRPARYGLSIQFEAREGDSELGRLQESTVWVN